MNNKLFSRVLCAILSILLLLPCLVACKQDTTTVEATKVVGTVDGENIYYDELYFLVNYYYDSAKAASGAVFIFPMM